MAQQIGMDLLARCRPGRVGAAIDRFDAHALHQGRDMQPAHRMAFAQQQGLQHPAARKGVVQMQFVDAPHQRQISA
jgi:hypothetical protein